MANKFRLPNSGDINWGSVLNTYIEGLDNRINSLETKYANLDQQSVIKNIGYASSGVVGLSNCIYDKSTITFTGNVFISGDVNTYFPLENFTQRLEGLFDKTAYYVFLNYYGEGFDIIARNSDEYQDTYNAILLGFLYKDSERGDQFVNYYDSSLKTIMEVQHELQYKWIDLEATNSLFSIEINDSKVPSSIQCGDYHFYCNGLTQNSISKFYTPENNGYKIIKPQTTKPIILKDSKAVDTEGKTYVVTDIAKEATPNADGHYFRILLDVFGHIMIQQSFQDEPLRGDGLLREQLLLNARFNNSLPVSLKPTLWIEVARFGYNRNEIEENTIYSQDYDKEGAKMFEDITFVRSITNGLAAQQSPRIWVSNDSKIDLYETTFIEGNNDLQGFKLSYEWADSQNDKQYGKFFITTAGSEPQKVNQILFTESDEDIKVGSITLIENASVQVTSDKRRKENFSNIPDSYLGVVESVPVLNYTYKNSVIPQVGIMAQDLEESGISNIDCFVKIEDSFELKNKRSLYETKLVYILWKALQEESNLRKKLEKRVADLEAK